LPLEIVVVVDRDVARIVRKLIAMLPVLERIKRLGQQRELVLCKRDVHAFLLR